MPSYTSQHHYIWFGTEDTYAPVGEIDNSAPTITIGVSGLPGQNLRIQYRKQFSHWQNLQLSRVNSIDGRQYYCAKFPKSDNGEKIDYEVYIISSHSREIIGDRQTFTYTKKSENPATRAHKNIEDDSKDIDSRLKKTKLPEYETNNHQKIIESNQISSPNDKQTNESDYSRFHQKQAQLSVHTSRNNLWSDEISVVNRQEKPELKNNGVSGIVVRPKDFKRLESIEVRVYTDPELNYEVGRIKCNSAGHFFLPWSQTQKDQPIWLRWIAGENSGRSPILEPLLRSQTIRVYPYRLADHPGSDGPLSKRKGRVLASTGRPLIGGHIWLVEHALRSCQYLASAVTQEDGSFEVAYPLEGLLVHSDPDIYFIVFDRQGHPLCRSKKSDLVLPVEVVDAWSDFDEVKTTLQEYAVEEILDLTPGEAEYIETRTGVSANTVLNYQEALNIAELTGADHAQTFALLSTPSHDVENSLKDSVRRGIVSRIVLSIQENDPSRQNLALASILFSEGPQKDLSEIFGEMAIQPQTYLEITQKWSQADSPNSFENELKRNPEIGTRAHAVRLALELSELIPYYPDLLKKIHRWVVQGGGIETVATWPISRWQDFLVQEEIALPSEFGAGEQGLYAFAGHLVKIFNAGYPAKVISELTVARQSETGQALLDMANRPKRAKTVFGNLASDRKRKQEKERYEIESLHALCVEPEPVMRMLEEGIHSPKDIARMGRREYTDKFGDAFLGGELDAAVTHSRAKRVSALGNYAYVALTNGGNTSLGHSSHKLQGKQRERASEALGIQDSIELDNVWANLSGGLGRSFCECPHCRSIFGPAAYLFDMLLFLARFTVVSDNQPLTHVPKRSAPLLQILMKRRPDIPRLDLTCDNTKIEVPQIDLVNELLSDLIAASVPEPPRQGSPGLCDTKDIPIPPFPIECIEPSDYGSSTPDTTFDKIPKPNADGFSFGCSPIERQTQGTSRERRALPQNEPPLTVLHRLKTTAFPWLLPYEYAQDKAWQAFNALPIEQDVMALAIWRFLHVTSEDNGETALTSLGWYFLNMSEEQRSLFTSPPYSLADVWGPAVSESVVSGIGPTLDQLRQVGDFDFSKLEASLTTAFVSGGSERSYELLPENSCDTREIRIAAERGIVCGILDRLHRFERLRRHLDWPATILDDALKWLGGELNEESLNALGILKFLEAKLELTPVRLIALFHNLDTTKRAHLFAETNYKSSFEELFGNSWSRFTLPNNGDLKLATDSVVSLVSNMVGEGPDEVRFVLSEGYANSTVEDLTDPANVLASAEPSAALRIAALATYRVARFARSLGLNLTDLIHLIRTFGIDPFLWEGNQISPRSQLFYAVQLISIVEESRDWHLDPIDIRYITTADAVAFRSQGLDPNIIGKTWLELLVTIGEKNSKRNAISTSGRVLLRQRLAELFQPASPEGPRATSLDITLNHIVNLLSWQYFFPDTLELVQGLLPSEIPESSYLTTETPEEDPWDPLYGFLAKLLETDYTDEDIGTSKEDGSSSEYICPSTPEDGVDVFHPETEDEQLSFIIDVNNSLYLTAEHALLVAVEQVLKNPSEFDVSRFTTSLSDLLANLGIDLEDDIKRGLANRYVKLAFEHASSVHSELLDTHAQNWADILLEVLLYQDAKSALVSTLSRICMVDESVIHLLLSILQEPGTETPIQRAFVLENGSLPRILSSLPIAKYAHKPKAGLSNIHSQVWERREPSLQFDWSSESTPDGISKDEFAVQIEAEIFTENLYRSGIVVPIVIETTGKVTLTLVGDSISQTVISKDANGKLEGFESDLGLLEEFYTELSPETHSIIWRINFETGEKSSPQVLKVWWKDEDDELIPVWPGNLGRSLTLIHKSSQVMGEAILPEQVWKALSRSSSEVDMNNIPVAKNSPTWVNSWQYISAIQGIWSRRSSDEQWAEMLSIITTSPIPVSDKLREFLGITLAETKSLLSLFPPSDDVDEKQEGIYANPECLAQALSLSTISQRISIPIAALLLWYEITPEEQFSYALGALRTLHPQDDWLEVLTTIYDPVRENLRDALLAWLTTHRRILGEKISKLPNMTLPPFGTKEAVSDELFTDVQVSACLQSSRVQFAYAAVQRFIDAMRLGFEVGPIPADREQFEREWSWRRMYRLWEANRRVFVHTANWLEPDLRPEKSEFFQQFEDDLMSGPLTSVFAERAFVRYLTKVAELARPEIIALVEQSEAPDLDKPYGFRDSDLSGTHVFARTRTQPRKLYYRRRYPQPDARWTPWQELPVEVPGTHYVALIAFGRLRLIATEILPAAPKRKSDNDLSRGFSGKTEVSIRWIDRIHGEWSKPTSVPRFQLDVPITAKVPESRMPEAFPGSGVYPDLRWDIDSIDKINVRIKLGHDGLNPNSKIIAKLLTNSDPLPIFQWYDEEKVTDGFKWLDSIEKPNQSISSIKPSEIEGLRLSWIPNGENDDCQIGAIEISFSKLSRDFPKITITEVTAGPDETNCQSETFTGLPVFLLSGGNAFELGETRRRCMQAKFKIKDECFSASPSMFESRLIPKSNTLDLAKALSLRVCSWNIDQDQDYFDIVIRSSKIEFSSGDVATEFQIKQSAIRDYPEILGKPQSTGCNTEENKGGWPLDWQAGKDLSNVHLETSNQELLRIRIYSDSTTSEINKPCWTNGIYSGTSFLRQDLVSNRQCNIGQTNSTASFPFYCSDKRAVSTPTCYRLVVPWNQRISSFVQPKILEENSTDNRLGRTFFVERIDEQVSHQSPGITTQVALASTSNSSPKSQSNSGSSIAVKDVSEIPLAMQSVQKIAKKENIYAPQGQVHLAASGQAKKSFKKWKFHTFWHPQAVGFLRIAEAKGIPAMLAYGNQALDNSSDLTLERSRKSFFSSYDPSSIVSQDWPDADVDFSIDGAYADYNWEIFYHAPLLIAQRLSEIELFEDAERWFRLLFDSARGLFAGDIDIGFSTYPLRHAEEQRVEDILLLLEDKDLREDFKRQVDRLNRFPYQPHLIARHRISEYKTALFMRYLDHHLAWGDMGFRRAYLSDNRTDLEIASSRYDLVAKLLGSRPDTLPKRERGNAGCFISLVMGTGIMDPKDVRLWDPVTRFSELIDSGNTSSEPIPNDGEGIPDLYFCVPHNDKLLEYWDILAERLFNLRNCRDIEGVQRTLSLYGRRIDPGLLVRAKAQGIDIDVLLGYVSAPLPRFRFRAMLQRAREAVDRASSFGQSLLSTIERKESEELALLQSDNEISLLKAIKSVRYEQLNEEKESFEALKKQLESAQIRLELYTSRERESPKELRAGNALSEAGLRESQAGSEAETASDWAWVPNLDITAETGIQSGTPWYYAKAGVGTRYSLGGDTGVKVHQNKAQGLRNGASAQRVTAAQLERQASFDLRWEDWELQAELARKEIQQTERRMTANEIRISIRELEHDNQQLQIENAQTVNAFYREKFTNVQLYRWRESRLSRLYYQQYRLAFDLVLKAQRALHYELGLEDAPPIPDGWNSRNRGMEAASSLQHELQKLQQTYIDSWQREHQKTKIFSLRDRQPLAFLDLQNTGSCVFEIRETDIDEDEPGDYFRRIKAIFVDIPCVRGPDVSVNARLTLLRSSFRTRAHRTSDSRYARAEGAEGAKDQRFRNDPGGLDHIVTSSGVNDAGMFEPNLNDERWLPFEGAGVISTWRLDLPLETNCFDRLSLSDIKLRIFYTSRAGGDTARTAALDNMADILSERPQPVLIDFKTWYPDSWHQFIQGSDDGHQLDLLVTTDVLPRKFRDSRIVGTELYFRMSGGKEIQIKEVSSIGRLRETDGIIQLIFRSPLRFNEVFSLFLDKESSTPDAVTSILWLRK